MKRSSKGFFGFMRSGKKLILATACFAILTQVRDKFYQIMLIEYNLGLKKIVLS